MRYEFNAERRVWFWSRVEKTDTCWLWLGAKSVLGYGYVHFRVGSSRKTQTAHRLSYEMANGDLGDRWALHTCDNPSCVNPAHLYAGSPADNSRDMALRDRSPNMKLTQEQRRLLHEMHANQTHSVSALARYFGVSRWLVRDILFRRKALYQR